MQARSTAASPRRVRRMCPGWGRSEGATPAGMAPSVVLVPLVAALSGRSECADRLRQRRLLVGGLVLVDDALGDGLVELARRLDERGRRGVLVATGDGLADAADVRL